MSKFKGRIIVPEEVLMREMDGESVILNMANENYYGLDPVGTRFWSHLTESDSIQEAFVALCKEFDVGVADEEGQVKVEEQTVRNDLKELLSELEKQGLIEISEE